VYPHDDIVRGRLGVGQVRQRQASDTSLTISNSDGLHYKSFLMWVVVQPDRLVVSGFEQALDQTLIPLSGADCLKGIVFRTCAPRWDRTSDE
jgi:hypothetical protein